MKQLNDISLRGDSPKLDFLRTVAVLLVTGAHLFMYLGDPVYLGRIQPSLLGPLGVVLFFVHTSLVLMLSIERQKQTLGEHRWMTTFYIRRIFRIYPLSIAAVLLTYFFQLPMGELQAHKLLPATNQGMDILFANLALVQNFFENSNLMGPLWSLPFEMQMYLVLPFCYLIAKRVPNASALHSLWAAFAILAFTLVPKIVKLNESLPYWEVPQFLLYIPCFWAGIVAFRAHSENRKQFSFLIFPAALVGLSLVFMLSYDKIKYIFAAYACGSLLPYVQEPSSKFLKKFCQIIARYSYGIYLFHYFSLWMAFELLKGSSPYLQWACFTGSLAVMSVAPYHLLEKPFINLGNAFAKRFFSSPEAKNKDSKAA